MTDQTLFNVLYSEQEKTVRIVSDELSVEFSRSNKSKGEKMIGQTDGIDNANDLEHMLKRINPELKIEVIKEKG